MPLYFLTVLCVLYVYIVSVVPRWPHVSAVFPIFPLPGLEIVADIAINHIASVCLWFSVSLCE